MYGFQLRRRDGQTSLWRCHDVFQIAAGYSLPHSRLRLVVAESKKRRVFLKLKEQKEKKNSIANFNPGWVLIASFTPVLFFSWSFFFSHSCSVSFNTVSLAWRHFFRFVSMILAEEKINFILKRWIFSNGEKIVKSEKLVTHFFTLVSVDYFYRSFFPLLHPLSHLSHPPQPLLFLLLLRFHSSTTTCVLLFLHQRVCQMYTKSSFIKDGHVSAG